MANVTGVCSKAPVIPKTEIIFLQQIQGSQQMTRFKTRKPDLLAFLNLLENGLSNRLWTYSSAPICFACQLVAALLLWEFRVFRFSVTDLSLCRSGYSVAGRAVSRNHLFVRLLGFLGLLLFR